MRAPRWAWGCVVVLAAAGCAAEGETLEPGFSNGGASGSSGDAGSSGSGGSSTGGSGGSSFGGSGGSTATGGSGGSATGGSGGSATGGSGGSSFGGTGGSTGGSGGSSFGGAGGTTSTGGSSGVGGSGGSATGGSGGACNDTGTEPNDSEAAAVNRPQIDDCDGSGSSVTGVLAGSGDVDWFKFKGDDDVFCSVNPYAFSAAVNVGARLCAFADCGGATELKSCKKGSQEFSPSGLGGCCTSGANDVELEINCPGTAEDNATIFMRIDQPNGNACIPYTLNYHY